MGLMGLKARAAAHRYAVAAGVLALVVAWSAGSAAHAQAPDGGKSPSPAILALYDEARAAYDRGDYAEAARILESAYRLSPDPALLWNIGRSYEKAGDYPKAIEAYAGFAAKAPTEKERVEAAERLIAVKAAYGKGWLTVRTDTPGARVQIDIEDEVDPPVVKKTLPAGEHWVTVTAPGMVSSRTRVTLAAGEETEINARLVAGAGAGGGQGGPSSESNKASLRTWGWVAFGVGAAAAGTGALLLGLGHADANEVTGADKNAAGNVVGLTRAEAEDLADSAKSKSAAGVGLLAAGGAGLVAGIVMIVVGQEDEPSSSSWRLIPHPTGVSLGGSF